MTELIVQVFEAKSLISHFSEDIDPYVVLKIGEQKRKSRIIKKIFNPIWKETIYFTFFFF